jgi:hypothetical protein
MFRNKLNNKIYIGSSNNLSKRKRDHLNLNIKSGCKLFRKAVIKYGIDNFEFTILEHVHNENNLFDREQYYLNSILKADFYLKGNCDYFIKNGYNLSPTANGRRGVKEIDVSHKFTKVIEYGRDGKFIKIWDSIQEASNFHNISSARITRICINKGKGLYPFRYYTSDYLQQIVFKKRIKTFSEETRAKISKTLIGRQSLKKRKVIQKDKQGNIINNFPSITEAMKITKIKGIANVLSGISKTAGGYLWE